MGLDIATTNFPNGISSMGVLTFGTGGLLPFAGKYFWVDETNGSDGNPGTAGSPLATLGAALDQCTSGGNNCVMVNGTIHVSATLNWNKDRTHLIGLNASSNNDRARISQTGSTVFTPLVNVTAQGCFFANIGSFHGFANASSQVCWAEAGGRNAYSNVQFMGMGNATAAAQAGGRSLTVSGNGENVFSRCQVGLDTITRSAANASLEFSGAVPRNSFLDCVFPFMTSASTPLGILVAGAAGIDRWQDFQRCLFVNNVQSTSTTMAGLSTLAASAGGLLSMRQCSLIGITEFGTDATSRGQIYVDGGAPTAGTTGIAVNPT